MLVRTSSGGKVPQLILRLPSQLIVSKRIENICHRMGFKTAAAWRLLLAVGTIFPYGDLWAAEQGRRPITVKDVIELRRPLADGQGLQILYSPDKRQFATLLMRGDLARDGYWVEIVVGSTASLQAAAQLKTVASMFTVARRENHIGLLSPTYPGHNQFTWLADNEHIAFRWSENLTPSQVRVVNVRTGEMRWLTHHPSSVIRYAIGDNGRRIYYNAFPVIPDDREATLVRQGFVAPTTYLADINGNLSPGIQPWRHLESFVADTGDHARPMVVHYSSGLQTWQAYDFPSAALQGQHAIVRRLNVIEGISGDPNETAEITLIDLRRGTTKALAQTLKYAAEPKVLWSDDGRRVAVGPVTPSSGPPWTGVAEIGAGNLSDVSLTPLQVPDGYSASQWCEDGTLALQRDGQEIRLSKAAAGWRQDSHLSGRCTSIPEPPVRLEWRQSMSTPPALFAKEVATGQEAMILDPAPTLRTDFQLGQQQVLEWKDVGGHPWEGRLYLPINFSHSRRYPLVIQTNSGLTRSEFALMGGAGLTAYAAQVLAGREIAVLQVIDHAGLREVVSTLQEAPRGVMGYESAVQHLVAMGIADPAKVGLMGYSHTGWLISNTITRSRMPFAAAVVADAGDFSYLGGITNGAGGTDYGLAKTFEATPFGEGLKSWLRESQAFHLENVHTPLRIELASGGRGRALLWWDFFSRLKALSRPVEYVIDPESEHGDHPLQAPVQQLASIQGAVDWMLFWLKGEENPDPGRRDQNARWRVLRQLQMKSLGDNR